MDGYILIHRKLCEWQWYKDSNTKSLFIDLLLDANWQESKSGFLTIERGQVLTSLKRMSLRTGLSYQEIRTSLDKLQKSGEINKQSTNHYSIITINKYDEYQDINKQATNKQQTSNNIKEYKKEKEYKEINNNKYIVENNIKEIIDYLNLRVGSHYMYRTAGTRHKIEVRLKEGFTIDDFKEVIDKKCVEWMNTDMQKYLRPETLFGTKFESYLNQEVVERKSNFQWNYLKGMYEGTK